MYQRVRKCFRDGTLVLLSEAVRRRPRRVEPQDDVVLNLSCGFDSTSTQYRVQVAV
jgi:hypothetical protein